MRDVFAENTGNRAFIDLLRTVGILQVVLFHVVHGIVRFAPSESITGFVDRMPFWMNFAWQAYGVDILFFLSAFLLTWSLLLEQHETGKISVRGFYIRRLSRILPLYYIAVLVFAVAQGNSWQEILSSALFVGYIVSDYNVIPVGWSMEVMILYYLALPWLFIGLSKARLPVLWLGFAILVTAVWRISFLAGQQVDSKDLFTTMIATKEAHPAFFELYFRPWFRLPAFLIGTLFAFLLVKKAQARLPLILLSLVVILAILWAPVQDNSAVAYRLPDWAWLAYWAWAPIVFAFALGYVTLSILRRGQHTAWQIPNWARGFSTHIFAVYLFHMPMLAVGAVIVFRTMDTTALGQAMWWQVIFVFLATAALSYLLAWPVTRYLEQPIQKWIRRITQ